MSTGKTIALIKGIGGSTGGDSGSSGGGLPSGGTPYQYLVTDGEGNTGWADRLAWKEGEKVELFPETLVDIKLDMGNGLYLGMASEDSFDFIADKQYEVVFNGASYGVTSVAVEDNGVEGVALGNLSMLQAGTDSGEPFVIIYVSNNLQIGTNEFADCTLAIYGYTETIHPIPAEYITGAPLTEADNGKVLGVVGGAIALVDALPAVSTDNNGQFLRVVNGAWEAATVPSGEGVSF